jgi:hypothetical protein
LMIEPRGGPRRRGQGTRYEGSAGRTSPWGRTRVVSGKRTRASRSARGGGRAQISVGMTGLPLRLWSPDRRSSVCGWTRCTAVASQVRTTGLLYPYGPRPVPVQLQRKATGRRRAGHRAHCGLVTCVGCVALAGLAFFFFLLPALRFGLGCFRLLPNGAFYCS